MSILSWLQRTVADFFCADTNDHRRAIAQAEAELAGQAAAALSVAGAQGGLELQDAVAERKAPAYELLVSPRMPTRERAVTSITTASFATNWSGFCAGPTKLADSSARTARGKG